MEPFNFAGVKFTRLSLKNCATSAMEAVKERRKFVVVAPSSRCISYAQNDREYRDFVNHVNLIFLILEPLLFIV